MNRNPADCGDGKHIAFTDDDGDKVCRLCKRVLVVGPLGVNGYSTLSGELLGYVSPLAVISEPFPTSKVYDSGDVPEWALAFVPKDQRRRGSARVKVAAHVEPDKAVA